MHAEAPPRHGIGVNALAAAAHDQMRVRDAQQVMPQKGLHPGKVRGGQLLIFSRSTDEPTAVICQQPAGEARLMGDMASVVTHEAAAGAQRAAGQGKELRRPGIIQMVQHPGGHDEVKRSSLSLN